MNKFFISVANNERRIHETTNGLILSSHKFNSLAIDLNDIEMAYKYLQSGISPKGQELFLILSTGLPKNVKFVYMSLENGLLLPVKGEIRTYYDLFVFGVNQYLPTGCNFMHVCDGIIHIPGIVSSEWSLKFMKSELVTCGGCSEIGFYWEPFFS